VTAAATQRAVTLPRPAPSDGCHRRAPAGLVSLIAVINAYNRLNVIVRQPAGDYQPGQWS
jgi:hypothetical protein